MKYYVVGIQAKNQLGNIDPKFFFNGSEFFSIKHTIQVRIRVKIQLYGTEWTSDVYYGQGYDPEGYYYDEYQENDEQDEDRGGAKKVICFSFLLLFVLLFFHYVLPPCR